MRETALCVVACHGPRRRWGGAASAGASYSPDHLISSPGYNKDADDTESGDDDVVVERSQMDSGKQQSTDSGTALPPLSWVLSVPRGVRAELRITGKDVRRDDLERLKKQIDFLVESFEESED